MTQEQKFRAHAANRRWKERHPERAAAYKHKHYLERKTKYLRMERERAYQKRYGIGVKEYDELFSKQNGTCAMCGKTTAGKNGQFFAVDHDHLTGEIRGLLCVNCNVFLGRYEKKQMMDMAENYLEKFAHGKSK